MRLVVSDGHSALPVRLQELPHIRVPVLLAARLWAGAFRCVSLQGRVALGEDAGERFGFLLVVVLIGERPRPSSRDSVGAYLTYAPRVRRTDVERNCVSNIRPEGLAYEAAARRIDRIAATGVARGVTEVGMRDESAGLLENC